MARRLWRVNVRITPARRCSGTDISRRITVFSFFCIITAPAAINMTLTWLINIASRALCLQDREPFTPSVSLDSRKMKLVFIPACLKLRLRFLPDTILDLEVLLISVPSFFLLLCFPWNSTFTVLIGLVICIKVLGARKSPPDHQTEAWQPKLLFINLNN